MTPDSNKLEVHFIKSSDFRTVYSSGVFGGFTPQGHLNIDFFNDRVPIPTKITYVATPVPEGLSMSEVERESKTGAIREFQFGVVMDLETAKELRRWLDEKLNQYDSVKNNI